MRHHHPCWNVLPQVLDPLPGLPHIWRVAEEQATGPDYSNHGRDRHGATHCLFKYSLAGCGALTLGGRSYRVPAGSGFLCEISDPSLHYGYPAEAVEPWHFRFAALHTDRRWIRSFIARYGPVHRLPVDGAIITRLGAFARHAGRGRCDLGAGEAMLLVAQLLAALLDAACHADGGDALIDRARGLIDAHLDRGLGVAELARQLGLRRESLNRHFRRHLGLTPSRYLQRERMRHACRLLVDEGRSVTAVAGRLGFDTPSHFARAFRRIIGLSPGAFQRSGWDAW